MNFHIWRNDRTLAPPSRRCAEYDGVNVPHPRREQILAAKESEVARLLDGHYEGGGADSPKIPRVRHDHSLGLRRKDNMEQQPPDVSVKIPNVTISFADTNLPLMLREFLSLVPMRFSGDYVQRQSIENQLRSLIETVNVWQKNHPNLVHQSKCPLITI